MTRLRQPRLALFSLCLRLLLALVCVFAFAVEAAVALSTTHGVRDELAFVSDRDGDADIYLFDAARALTYNLTRNSPGIDAAPVWSRDGALLAFCSNRDGLYNLYVMDASGGGVRQLTTASVAPYSAVWSPDHSQIAFLSYSEGTQAVYRVRLTDGEVRRVSEWNGTFSGPAWSPDGARLAYSFSNPYEWSANIYILGAASDAPINLTDNSAYNTGPIWSPNGTSILYSAILGGLLSINMVDLDGANRRILYETVNPHTQLRWSPDGRWLSFVAENNGYHNLYRMDERGERQQLTTNNRPGFMSYDWSPDSQRIAFTQINVRGDTDLYTLSLHDGLTYPLAVSDGLDTAPAWRP